MTKNFCNSNHILVGLGGTGGKILRAFKMRMFEEFPTQEERGKLSVALLYVDSTDEMMPKDGKARADFRVMGQDASFTNNEFLNIKAVDVEHILDHIDNFPSVKGIVENVAAVKSAIGRSIENDRLIFEQLDKSGRKSGPGIGEHDERGIGRSEDGID